MVKTSPKVPDGGSRETKFFEWSEHKESQNLVKR